MKPRIKNTDITIKVIGWLQILGGILGFVTIGKLLLRTDTINGPVLLLFLIGISLFIFSISSGRYILSKSNLKLGLILSLINFCLQLLNIEISGYGLSYSLGFNLLIGIDNGFKVHLGLIDTIFSMAINSKDTDFIVKVNVVAIIAIWTIAD